MCNCGNKRNALRVGAVVSGISATPMPAPALKMWPDVLFAYTGQSALTITGYITGIKYRFSKAGEVLPVDYRDAGTMSNVPVLKKLSSRVLNIKGNR